MKYLSKYSLVNQEFLLTNNCSSQDIHCTNTVALDLSASRVFSDWDNKIGGEGRAGQARPGQFLPSYGNTMFHIVAKLGLIEYTCATLPHHPVSHSLAFSAGQA